MCATLKPKNGAADAQGEAPALSRRNLLLGKSGRSGTKAAANRIVAIGAECGDHRICVAICPAKALHGYASLGRRGVALDPAACDGCGKCVAVCPQKAIRPAPRTEPPQGRKYLILSVHRETTCAVCGDPFAGGPGQDLCAACRKDRDLFGFGRTAAGEGGGVALELSTSFEIDGANHDGQ